MSEEVKENTTNELRKDKLCIGLDVGTMNIICARSDSSDVNLSRNVFLKLDPEEVSISELSDISYIQSEDDNELFIIGEDAFRFSNIFGQTVSRPMESGLISSKEIDAAEVLSLMITNLIGDVKNKDTYVSYSIPAESIDENKSVTYHEKVFGRILDQIGANYTSVNEAMAIIYSECANENFSGIGISFGAGMTNISISYKGIQAAVFSTSRSGDWIDKNVADSLNMVPNRVTSIKEKNLDLTTSFMKEKNKKKRRVLEALEYYYGALIDYTVKKIIHEFDDRVDLEIDDEIPIVIAGGTSIPKGFLDLFKSTVGKYDLPFEVSEIRRAKEPLLCVANGLLVKTISDIK